MTAADTDADLAAEIDDISEEVHELVASEHQGVTDATNAELRELAARALRLACACEHRADPAAVTRLKTMAAELADLAREQGGRLQAVD